MSENISNFDFYNRIFERKPFHYEGPLFYFSNHVLVKFDFNIKITGLTKKIVVGNWKPFLKFDVEIYNTTPKTTFEVLTGKPIEEHLERIVGYEITSFLPFLGLEEYYVQVENIKILNNTEKLNESTSEKRNIVREVVKDMITIFKKGQGEYSLPEDLTGEMEYDFHNLNTSFSVDFKIEESDSVDGFELDGGYYDEDDLFEISVIYNPKYFPNQFYDLIGELNELFRHELQHLIQNEKGVDRPKDNLPAEKYYLQPHEIDAQIQGFRRLSKIRKQPFEEVVRNWYNNNTKLNDKNKEKVIQIILSNYK